MFWRQPSQKIRGMQDPDLRTRGIDSILVSRIVMHDQVRLQGFDQSQDMRPVQFGMDGGSGKVKGPARANRDNVWIPSMAFVRTPHIKHALSAAYGKVPRHEMDQSWTAVSWPKVCEVFYQL